MTEYDIKSFSREIPVSRETLKALGVFVSKLVFWQRSMNLVGARTLEQVWKRHILDSAQIFGILEEEGRRLDMGSGAGYPGRVLAILGRPNVGLLESSGKKCSFLRHVVRELGLEVEIIQSRIEDYKPTNKVKFVTARALAPLDRLLEYSWPLIGGEGKGIFLKGKTVNTELTMAKNNWMMELVEHPSKSDASGVILEIGGIKKIHVEPSTR